MVAIFWSLFSTGITWVINLIFSQAFRAFFFTAIVGLFLKLLGFLGIYFLTSAILTPIFDLFLSAVEGGLSSVVNVFEVNIFQLADYVGFIPGIRMLCAAYVFRFTYKTMISFAPFQGSLFK